MMTSWTATAAAALLTVIAAVGQCSAADAVVTESSGGTATTLLAIFTDRWLEQSSSLARVYTAFLVTVPLVLRSSDQTFRHRARVAYVLIFLLTPCAMKFTAYTRIVGVLIALAVGYELSLMFRARCSIIEGKGQPSTASYVIAALCWVQAPLVIFSLGSHQLILDCIDIVTMVLLSDAYQYIGGHVLKFDDRRPFPTLSPNKSLGGYVFAVLSVALIYALLTHWSFLESVGIVLFGLFGDLTASLIKRDAASKDFGRFLGAHGGVTDRFDGCFMAVTIFSVLRFGLLTTV